MVDDSSQVAADAAVNCTLWNTCPVVVATFFFWICSIRVCRFSLWDGVTEEEHVRLERPMLDRVGRMFIVLTL